MPGWLNWIEYISWFSYGNEALNINQWDGVEGISCPPVLEKVTVPLPEEITVDCPDDLVDLGACGADGQYTFGECFFFLVVA